MTISIAHTLMHPRIAEIREVLQARREALHAAAAPLSTEHWASRPSPDRWSVAELYQHLYLVERSVAKMLRQKIDEARANGHPAETSQGSSLDVIDWKPLLNREKTRQAPPHAEPREAPDAAVALRQLSESRATLHGVMDDADGLALSTLRQTHAAIGDVDLYQWMLFVGYHEARHTAQVTEIVAAMNTRSS